MIRLKELLTQVAEKRMAEAMRRQAASPEMEKLGQKQGIELPGASEPADIGADKRSGMQDKPSADKPSPSSPKPVVSTNPDIAAAKARKAQRDAEMMAKAKAEFDQAMADDEKNTNPSAKAGVTTATALPPVDELEKSTLKSYLKKANKSAESELRKSDDHEDKAMSIDGEKHSERQQKHVEKAKEYLKKYQKRQKGISTASKKIGDK